MRLTSAAQRREQARRAYNANLAECPGHDLLAALSDKWLTLIVSAPAGGPLRYAELSREVAGASEKMLTQTLRKLERDGLVGRTVTAAVPGPGHLRAHRARPGTAPAAAGDQELGRDPCDRVREARRSFDLLSEKQA